MFCIFCQENFRTGNTYVIGVEQYSLRFYQFSYVRINNSHENFCVSWLSNIQVSPAYVAQQIVEHCKRNFLNFFLRQVVWFHKEKKVIFRMYLLLIRSIPSDNPRINDTVLITFVLWTRLDRNVLIGFCKFWNNCVERLGFFFLCLRIFCWLNGMDFEYH